MSEPMRVLHVLGGIGLGGAESRIMDLYREIDRDRIQFDFLIHTQEKGYFEEEILSLGGKIYTLPRFKGYNLVEYYRAIKGFFKRHTEFGAVHGHMTSTASLYLPIARKAGIPITIAHARSAGTDPGIKGWVTRLLRKSLSRKTDFNFACSTEAARAVFGDKSVEAGNVRILPNAIVASDFKYQAVIRDEIRKKLGIEDKFVIGHVGRFHYAKNHEFLVDIFKEIARSRQDAVLLLLGEGSLMDIVKEKVQKLELTEKVIFAGNQKNIADYYMAMDYLVFPSRFEGLPGTIVEAQATGLHCLMSDSVTPEVMVTECVKSKSLKMPVQEWAQEVLKDMQYDRRDYSEEVKNAGFDARTQAEWLTQFYQKKREKILLIVPMLHQGGFEKVCVRTARLLSEYCDVSILIFSNEDIAYDISGLHVINIDIKSSPRKIGKLLNVIKRVIKVRKIKKQMRYTVTYSFGITANLINVLSRCQDRIWVGIRGFTDLYSKLLPLFCKKSDLIICCSKAIEEIITDRFPGRNTVTVYNPYDVKQMEEMAKAPLPEWIAERINHKKVILSMGREDEVKGFWHLIKSFYLVQEKEPNTCLIIIGEGEYLPYKKLALDLGIKDKVIFTGVLKNPFPCLASANVYALTSLHEGFPNALVEAMAVGVPVVATNCLSGPAEILGEEAKKYYNRDIAYHAEYGILLPVVKEETNYSKDIIEEEERIIAEKIIYLLQNQVISEHYVIKGRQRVSAFSDQSYKQVLMSLFQ